MGIVKGLKSIQSHNEAEDAKYSGGGEKTRWFKIEDKQSVKVAFLQELDEDSPDYSAKNDLGFLAVEHVNPKNFRRKALCTIDDEGSCYGCDTHQKDWKAGWKQKSRLYINALVDDGKNEPYVVVLSQGNGPKSITPALIEEAGDGSISQVWYTIKRTGSGPTDTSYLLRGGKEAHGLDVESYELYDLDKVVRQIPYAEQEAHYNDGDAPAEAAEGASETKGADPEVW